MYATPEQFSAANKASVDALHTIAIAHLAAFERLSTLSLTTAKAAFEDTVNQAKALLSVKDAREFVNLTAATAQPRLERAIAYSHSVYELATQAQAEITKLLNHAGENISVTAVTTNVAKQASKAKRIPAATTTEVKQQAKRKLRKRS